MREIDITKEPINCSDELLIGEQERSIEATYERWMDVHKYFGTRTRNLTNSVARIPSPTGTPIVCQKPI